MGLARFRLPILVRELRVLHSHLALNLLDQARAVNVSVAMPLVRTSVAHGTAFDIAGKGIADAGSLVEAVRVAARLALNPAK